MGVDEDGRREGGGSPRRARGRREEAFEGTATAGGRPLQEILEAHHCHPGALYGKRKKPRAHITSIYASTRDEHLEESKRRARRLGWWSSGSLEIIVRGACERQNGKAGGQRKKRRGRGDYAGEGEGSTA